MAVLDCLPLAVVKESIAGIASTWHHQQMGRAHPALFARLIEACELSVRVNDRLEFFLFDLMQF